MVHGGRPLRENWPKLTNPHKNADFQSEFARSASAVTPSEKVQLTQIGSQL